MNKLETIGMKALLTFTLGGISLVGTLFTVLPAGSADAAFTCGPHLATYRVKSLSGVAGKGVRCLKIDNTGFSGYWYGEGYWRNQKYRHLGMKAGDMGMADDIYGNGENTGGHFFPLGILKISTSSGGIPQKVQITGAWSEEWTLEEDGVVNDYTTVLGPVRTCGRNFHEFGVSSLNGNISGQGVRCVMPSTQIWYGQGTWNGRTYAHIGVATLDNSDPNRDRIAREATDICEPSISSSCGVFPLRSIIFSPPSSSFDSSVFRVTGAWAEEWRRR